MTSYATVADFVLAFGEQEAIDLSNLDDPTETSTNESVIERALDSATADIDSYLRAAGYTLPLSDPPAVLAGKCLDIARYKLDRINTREEVRQRYLDAIYWCKDLAKGTATLGITSISSEVALPEYFTGKRLYTPDSLWDY